MDRERTAIVAGVDGSDGGRRALQFALGEAMLRGCRVIAVRIVADSKDSPPAEKALRRDVENAVRETRRAPLVDWEVHIGDPATAFLRLSADAGLLVISSHGSDGSVTSTCTHLALCPVVVLPSP